MSEHLRHLSRHADIPVTCMPNAGLPMLTKDGAAYPLSPEELAKAHTQFVAEFGLALVGGCCGHRTPAPGGRGRRESTGEAPEAALEAAVASLYQSAVPQDASYLSIGSAPTPTGPRPSATRCSRAGGTPASRSPGTRPATGPICSTCVDYVGRDGVDDMRQVVGRLATSSTLPPYSTSTEPPVIEAGSEMLGGRAVINSVNFEDGDGPGSRYERMMRLVQEHGAAVVALTIDEEGQARTRTRRSPSPHGSSRR